MFSYSCNQANVDLSLFYNSALLLRIFALTGTDVTGIQPVQRFQAAALQSFFMDETLYGYLFRNYLRARL